MINNLEKSDNLDNLDNQDNLDKPDKINNLDKQYDISKKLKKYYKSFLLGKQHFENNKETACDYFKKSLILLDELKKTNKYNDLVKETETECKQYLTKSIEYYLDSEIQLKNNINYNELLKSIEQGDVNIIKNYNYNEIDWIKLIDNQTLLHHAVKYGDTGFLKNAFKIGALIDTPNGYGHTLLEYACLQEDPNIISFLINNGANMQKHLYFREGKFKYLNLTSSMDNAIIIKHIMLSNNLNINMNISNKINSFSKYFELEHLIGINDYTYSDLFHGLTLLLTSFDETSANTYLNIIDEELSYNLKNKLGCPKSKLDILLINLVPFINYKFSITSEWVLSMEIKYIILKLINNKNIRIKNELVDIIWDTYIKSNIVSKDFIGTLISQWIIKIKV
jgi:ankyrin repeat protein